MGLFSFPNPADWHALGYGLGLTAYAPSAGYGPGVSFRRIKRSCGVPVSQASSFSHWFHGVWRGCEVFVLQYETGSGSTSTTWTAAIARIDPPLFLGLSIREHGFLDKIFGRADIHVGDPEADARLDIAGFDPARVASFLSPADPACRQALARMTSLLDHWNLYVGDSVVQVHRPETITDPARIAPMLDAAVELAGWFAQRRRLLPALPGEQAQREAWTLFAQAHSFAFDPDRMTLSGERDGSSVNIALETEGQSIRTVVTARFPGSVHVAFTLRRSACPGFLQGLFSQDIKVGDNTFDSMFVITGHPEHAVRVALARPRLLGILKHLGAHAHDLQLNHQELFFRVDGPSSRATDIEGLTELACSVGQELFSAVKDMGPYR